MPDQEANRKGLRSSAVKIQMANDLLEPNFELRETATPSFPSFQAPQKAIKQARAEILYGEYIDQDEKLSRIVEREKFLLSVVMPRFRTLSDMRREWIRNTLSSSVLVPLVTIIVLHVVTLSVCSTEASTFCAYGPDSILEGEDTGMVFSAFSEYGPPMINALATLLLSFYANVCMGLYSEGYFA